MLGVGAIGRSITLQLAQLGIEKFHLIDPDKVAPENLGTQGYHERDVERHKTSATLDEVERINHNTIDYNSHQVERLDASNARSILSNSCLTSRPNPSILILTPDNMQARRDALEAVSCMPFAEQPHLIVDIRMLGEVFQVRLLRPQNQSVDKYLEDHVFDDTNSISASCTTRMTGYAATCAASVGVLMITKFLRGMDVPPLVSMDLFSMTLDVSHD